MNDVIELRELRCSAIVGVLAEERERAQPLIFDLELVRPFEAAMHQYLSDEKGALCGKMFADMGAEVIKVEPPQGCPSRKIPPFLNDQPDLEHSLHFLAFQAGKRSITLNVENADGRELLKQLVRHSDFLVEAFPLGYLDSLGLGYETLAKLNPRLIHVSITPFGDKGLRSNRRRQNLRDGNGRSGPHPDWGTRRQRAISATG